MRKLRLLDVWIIFPWKQSQSVTPHSLSTDWVLSEYRECTLCVWDWEWLVFSLQGKRDFLFSSLFANPPSSPFKVNTGPRTWSQETCVPVLALKSAGHVIMDRSSRSLTCFCIHKMRGTAEVADVLALHFSGFRILWTRMINLGLSTPLSSTLVCGTAMLLLDVQGTEKEESFFFFFFFNVLYTRRPWCDGLRGLVTLCTQYYSTLCLKGRKEWIYWLATLTRACVSGLLLCGMIRLQWQGQVKLEQQKTSLTFTWTQGHS